MKKVILPLSFAIAFISLALTELNAQICVPDGQYTQAGLYPDTITGLKDGTQCVYYDQLLTIVVPADTFVSQISATCTIVSVELTGIAGLPPGLIYDCEPSSCVFLGGANGCGLIFGTPTDTGSYSITATTTTILSGPGLCSTVNPILVNQPLSGYSINISSPLIVSGIDASCAGVCDGSATVSHAGLTAPFTYTWSDLSSQTSQTATGLCAGVYAVTVTDSSGCNSVETVSIGNTSAISTTTSTVSTSCGLANGTATAISTAGTAPYTYNWSSGDTLSTAIALAQGTHTVSVTDANGCTDSASAMVTAIAPMVLTYTSTFSTCGNSDGIVTINVSAGTPPYNGWGVGMSDTTISGLTSGTYTIVFTDALGCVDSIMTTVSDTGGLAVSQSAITMVSCNGQCDAMATATATGVVGSLTYSWNTTPVQTTATATGLCAGTHMATVSDSVCNASLSVTITEASALVITSESSMDPSCNGAGDESLVVIASGGVLPLLYSIDGGSTWVSSGSFTAMGAGTYDVNVMDSVGCMDSSSVFTITDPSPVVITSATSTNITCNGLTDGSIVVLASGGVPPLEYSLDGGVNYGNTTGSFIGLGAGNSVIAVRDSNGCQAFGSSVVFTEPTALTASVSATLESTTGASDGSVSVSVSGGTGPFTYSWNTVPIQDSAIAIALTAGDYVVIVTDANGCMISDTTTVSVGTAVYEEMSKLINVKLYPNPAKDELNIEINLNYNFTFIVYDVRGKQVLSEVMVGGNNIISLANLSTGLYVYHIIDNSGAALNHGKFNILK